MAAHRSISGTYGFAPIMKTSELMARARAAALLARTEAVG